MDAPSTSTRLRGRLPLVTTEATTGVVVTILAVATVMPLVVVITTEERLRLIARITVCLLGACSVLVPVVVLIADNWTGNDAGYNGMIFVHSQEDNGARFD